MKATEQHFTVVLFIMLYEVVLTFESVGEILKCDHSNESYRAVFLCGAVYSVCFTRWFLLFSLWMKPLSVKDRLHKEFSIRFLSHFYRISFEPRRYRVDKSR